MAALPWVGLIVFCAVTLVGATFATVRGLDAWRALNSLRRRLDDEVLETTRRFDRLEERLGQIDEGSARLEAAKTRLAESLARARVLFGALDDARDLAATVKGLVPR